MEKQWFDKGDAFQLSVTSDGTTEKQWGKRLERKGFSIGSNAMNILNEGFAPTRGITSMVIILKSTLFTEKERTERNIRAEAERRGLLSPHPEIACLIREKLENKDMKQMGMRRVLVMHTPIRKYPGGALYLLGIDRRGGTSNLMTYCSSPPGGWSGERGFAFVQP